MAGRELMSLCILHGMSEKFLENAYGLETPEKTREFYDAWSGSYDEDVAEAGYATPERLSAALAKFTDLSRPVLDFGCGTGLSGAALREQRFQTIDGMDASSEMLERAHERGIYRNLTFISNPKQPPPIETGVYGAIVACGVIGSGAAPLPVFDALMSVLASKGFIAFSFNDHTLKDRSFEGRINDYIDTAAARLRFWEYGPHLPGIHMKSMVYVLEKA